MKWPEWLRRKPRPTPVRPALQRVIEHAERYYLLEHILQALPEDLRWGDEIVIRRKFTMTILTIPDPEHIRVSIELEGEGVSYLNYNANTGEFTDV